MREVIPREGSLSSEAQTFRACLATILELPVDAVPQLAGDKDITRWRVMRWLGGLGLGLVPIADASEFSWAGPWIARVQPADQGPCRSVVMYGVPSGVVWDPAGVTGQDSWRIQGGFLIAALDIALARPSRVSAPTSSGSVEAILVAVTAGAPQQAFKAIRALAERGLQGDRHVTGKGTFPSGLPGSALTLIEAEVCESFTPPLDAGEHHRNLVTRGIDLNALVSHEFAIGEVLCRGMRLCEPCTVVEGYASRPVLRQLVHRGGLRADILADGVIRIGDRVHAVADLPPLVGDPEPDDDLGDEPSPSTDRPSKRQ